MALNTHVLHISVGVPRDVGFPNLVKAIEQIETHQLTQKMSTVELKKYKI